MKLYIAEKPSLGRAIADVLPKPHRSGEGCIYVGDGDCVSWCVGHLLEQVQPEVYAAKYKQWQMEHLPIVPETWQLQAKSNSRKQLAVLRKLIKQADHIVHAGDPDREGQLLVDQVIAYCGISATKRKAIQRCLINDLNPAAVRRALAALRDNRDFIPLSTSALARSRADWLYGINMTRALTLQGRKVGYQGLLSVGRVQTPLLGLVVRRDQAIDDFIAKPFFQLIAHLQAPTGEQFYAKWQPSEACLPWQDEEGRVLNRALVANVAARIECQSAAVIRSKKKQQPQGAPLPYNLSSLQIDAAKRFGMSAKQVLDYCQSLYERHKLLTYPRSDCRYLPVEHFKQAPTVLAAITANTTANATADTTANTLGLGAAVKAADQSLKGRAWNDAKVSAHHAIIPTARIMTGSSLSVGEARIYELVARQYVAQFYPPFIYSDQRIELTIAGGLFIAKARQTLSLGWKQLFPKANAGADVDATSSAVSPALKPGFNLQLPALTKGQQCHCEQAQILEKQTSAPQFFDDASLLSAMTGIARYVHNADIRKILTETDGLGTDATRAGIIELLFDRAYLQRKGKKIHATQAGAALIAGLPVDATTPDMTAQWEMQLNAISQKQSSYEHFMQPLLAALQHMIKQCQAQLPTGLSGLKASYKGRAKKGQAKPRRKKITAAASKTGSRASTGASVAAKSAHGIKAVAKNKSSTKSVAKSSAKPIAKPLKTAIKSKSKAKPRRKNVA